MPYLRLACNCSILQLFDMQMFDKIGIKLSNFTNDKLEAQTHWIIHALCIIFDVICALIKRVIAHELSFVRFEPTIFCFSCGIYLWTTECMILKLNRTSVVKSQVVPRRAACGRRHDVCDTRLLSCSVFLDIPPPSDAVVKSPLLVCKHRRLPIF